MLYVVLYMWQMLGRSSTHRYFSGLRLGSLPASHAAAHSDRNRIVLIQTGADVPSTMKFAPTTPNPSVKQATWQQMPRSASGKPHLGCN